MKKQCEVTVDNVEVTGPSEPWLLYRGEPVRGAVRVLARSYSANVEVQWTTEEAAAPRVGDRFVVTIEDPA